MTENARKRIRLQLMWDRLIAVVEEQAQAILRTAFGSVVREAGDLSTGIYDLEGRMLAQAVTGTPGHVNTMAKAVMHFLDRFPLKTMKLGRSRNNMVRWLLIDQYRWQMIIRPRFQLFATQ